MIEYDPPPHQVAEKIRMDLIALRTDQHLKWYKPWRVLNYARRVGLALEMVLGQYHQDHMPKEGD